MKWVKKYLQKLWELYYGQISSRYLFLIHLSKNIMEHTFYIIELKASGEQILSQDLEEFERKISSLKSRKVDFYTYISKTGNRRQYESI